MKKITEIRYMRRFNRGGYEHEEYSISLVPDDGQSAEESFAEAKELVDSFAASDDANPSPPNTGKQEGAKNGKESKDNKKSENSKEKANEKSGKKSSEEVVADQEGGDDEDAENGSSDTPPAKKKKFRSKASPYDRSNDLHKRLVTDLLASKIKNWKQKADLAKKISMRMNGMDFLDSEGEMLTSFRDEYLAKMGGK